MQPSGAADRVRRPANIAGDERRAAGVTGPRAAASANRSAAPPHQSGASLWADYHSVRSRLGAEINLSSGPVLVGFSSVFICDSEHEKKWVQQRVTNDPTRSFCLFNKGEQVKSPESPVLLDGDNSTTGDQFQAHTTQKHEIFVFFLHFSHLSGRKES